MKQTESKSKEASDFTFDFYPDERQTIDKSTITDEDALEKSKNRITEEAEKRSHIYHIYWIVG